MTTWEQDTIEVIFTDDDTDDERRSRAESTIKAMRDRTLLRHELRNAREEAVAALTPRPAGVEPVHVPDDDPAVATARSAIEAEMRGVVETLNAPPIGAGAEALAAFHQPATDGDVANQVFPIPYHYDWKWREGPGWFFRHEADRPSGAVNISVVARKKAWAHAGFGVELRTDHTHVVTARSLRRSSEVGHAHSGTTGAWALSTGGMEMTVFDRETLKGEAIDQRWRLRLNPSWLRGSETAGHNSEGTHLGNPLEVTWTMEPGRIYNLNVGAWVHTEWVNGDHSGGDISNASGTILSEVLAITLFHS